MPEGPEVRRFADLLDQTLAGQPIVELTTRSKIARQWLHDHPKHLSGKTIESVRSHGKNLIGRIEGGGYFYSHLMMWGRWQAFEGALPVEVDRRERARIVVPTGGVILYSAPVFELGEGDPYQQIALLQTLGTDVLPDRGESFDDIAFRQKLLASPERAIGAILLDQQVVAGIGNYLRAEILFDCRLDPWRKVADLSATDLNNLCISIPKIANRAYLTGGFTVTEAARSQMEQDSALVYRAGSEFGTRHYVFRRTNLPCLVCGSAIRQLRQTVRADEEGEKTRIIYFCPTCQNTQVELKVPRRRTVRKQEMQ
jgi:endonuclease VIII